MSKPFQELCFTDDFMFCKVMQDPKICKGVLELILGIRIRKIVYPEPQKTLTGTLDTHGIRLDVYTEDEDNRVFDVEMQTYQDDLARRSRFYNGMIDRALLKPGADYKELNYFIRSRLRCWQTAAAPRWRKSICIWKITEDI